MCSISTSDPSLSSPSTDVGADAMTAPESSLSRVTPRRLDNSMPSVHATSSEEHSNQSEGKVYTAAATTLSEFDDTLPSNEAVSNGKTPIITRTSLVMPRRERRPSLVASDVGSENGDDESDTAPTLNRLNHHHEDADSVGSNSNTQTFCTDALIPDLILCQVPDGDYLADQLNLFTACRHPLEFLGIVQEDEETAAAAAAAQRQPQEQPHRVSGYHAIPTTCEYCGAPSLDQCRPARNLERRSPPQCEEDDDGSTPFPPCQRPTSFFPRQRPPFWSKAMNQWDENGCFIGIRGPKKQLAQQQLQVDVGAPDVRDENDKSYPLSVPPESPRSSTFVLSSWSMATKLATPPSPPYEFHVSDFFW